LASRQQAIQLHDPLLRSFSEQFEALRMDCIDLIAGMTASQFNWRPAPRRWSVGQCLEHVVLTARLYPEPVGRMIGEARIRQARGERPYRQGLLARWLISSREPPPGLRVRSPRRVEPKRDLDMGAVTRAFMDVHGQLASLVALADGVSLDRARMTSPFLPLLKLTLGQAFEVNLAHARRHLWQARQVIKEPRFPAPY
jgi:hypothetical protein